VGAEEKPTKEGHVRFTREEPKEQGKRGTIISRRDQGKRREPNKHKTFTFFQGQRRAKIRLPPRGEGSEAPFGKGGGVDGFLSSDVLGKKKEKKKPPQRGSQKEPLTKKETTSADQNPATGEQSPHLPVPRRS